MNYLMHKLNVIPDKVLPLIKVSQFDDVRHIVFYLYNEDEPFYPEEAKVIIEDNELNATIVDNEVSFDFTDTAEVKKVMGEIRIGNMGSCNFVIEIDSTPFHEETDINNLALSILMGRNVKTDNPLEPLNIIMRGEE